MVVKGNQWLENRGQWSWVGHSTHNVPSLGRKTIKSKKWAGPEVTGGHSGDSLTASVCMGGKQWWWSHAKRELPDRAAVLVPRITWSSVQEPSLICLPGVVSFYGLTLPSSVLIGWTLLTLPSLVRLSLELTPTWASSGVKDNSSWWKPEAGTWVPGIQKKMNTREQGRAGHRENEPMTHCETTHSHCQNPHQTLQTPH